MGRRDMRLMVLSLILFVSFTARANDCEKVMALIAGGTPSRSAFTNFVLHLAVNRNALDAKTLDRLMTSDKVFNPLDLPSKNLSDLENRAFRAGLQMEIDKGRASISEVREHLGQVLSKIETQRAERKQATEETKLVYHVTPKDMFLDDKANHLGMLKVQGDPTVFLHHYQGKSNLTHWPSGKNLILDEDMYRQKHSSLKTTTGRVFLAMDVGYTIRVFDGLSGKEILSADYGDLFKNATPPLLHQHFSRLTPRLFERENGDPALLISWYDTEFYVAHLQHRISQGLVVDILPDGGFKAKALKYDTPFSLLPVQVKGGLFSLVAVTPDTIKLLNAATGQTVSYPIKDLPHIWPFGMTPVEDKTEIYATPDDKLIFAAYHEGFIYLSDLKAGLTRRFPIPFWDALRRAYFHQAPNGDILLAVMGHTTHKDSIFMINFTKDRIWTSDIGPNHISNFDFLDRKDGTSLFIISSKQSTHPFDFERIVIIDDSNQTVNDVFFDIGGSASPLAFRETEEGRLETLIGDSTKIMNYEFFGPVKTTP